MQEFNELSEVKSHLLVLEEKYGSVELVKTYSSQLTDYESIIDSTLLEFENKIIDAFIYLDKKLIRVFHDTENKKYTVTEVNSIEDVSQRQIKTMEELKIEIMSLEDRRLLEKYITNSYMPVYCFKNLPEEVVAVILSYVSRSPNTFKENLLKLLKDEELNMLPDATTNDLVKSTEKASKFHEKWILGYGHNSCAELAQIKFGIDKISILATKEFEDNRLGSYIEKSTRYQQFTNNSYFIPTISSNELTLRYCDLMDYIFHTYNSLFALVEKELKVLYPIKENQKEKAYNNSIHAKACDILRYILPLSTYTSLGASFNARVMANSLTKLLSSQYEECKELAQALKAESLKICPTLIKYASKNEYRSNDIFKSQRANIDINKLSMISSSNKEEKISIKESSVSMCHISQLDAINKVVAYMLYSESDESYNDIYRKVKELSLNYKQCLLEEYIEDRGSHDTLQRAFETITLDFDIVSDYGAFRDLQRHRLMTQFKQVVTPKLNFSLHPDTYKLSTEIIDLITQCFYYSNNFYTLLLQNSDKYIAQYCLLMGTNIRYSYSANVRQIANLIELRSKPQGHISYRQIANKLFDEIQNKLPVFAKLINVVRLTESTGLERMESESKNV